MKALAMELMSTVVDDLALTDKVVEEIDTLDKLTTLEDVEDAVETVDTLEDVVATLESLPSPTTDNEAVMYTHVLESIERRVYAPTGALTPALESADKKDNILKRMYEAIKAALIKMYKAVSDFLKGIWNKLTGIKKDNEANKETLKEVKRLGITTVDTVDADIQKDVAEARDAMIESCETLMETKLQISQDNAEEAAKTYESKILLLENKVTETTKAHQLLLTKIDDAVDNAKTKKASVSTYDQQIKEVDAIYDAMVALQKVADAAAAQAQADLKKAAGTEPAALKAVEKTNRKKAAKQAKVAAQLAREADKLNKAIKKSLRDAIADANDK